MPTLNIGNLTLGNNFPTRLAASFWQSTTPEKLRDLKKRGLDIAEIRLDLCDPPNRTAEFVRQFSREIPTLATIRLKSEGGKWDDSEESRLQLFRAVIPSADAIDIELSARNGILGEVVTAAKNSGKAVIISKHDFSGIPADAELHAAYNDAFNFGADVFKLAVTVDDADSLQRLSRFVRRINGGNPFAIMGMGELGKETRRAFIAQNALTYACVDKPTVAGQIQLDEAAALLDKSHPPQSTRRTFPPTNRAIPNEKDAILIR